MSFDSFDLHPKILANITALGYEAPTPIQTQALPQVIAGKDIMGLAQTGTGKTAAFLLPIIDRFMKNPKAERGSCRALVIAPTRELAEQIHESAKAYAKGLKFKSSTVYGGVGMGPQTLNLRRGSEMVVACPGRLLDHMSQNHCDLSQVEVLVLDEADHMFDMGFLPDIKKILASLPAKRQTLLFSATMPDSIRGLAAETLKDPAVVSVGRQAPGQTIDQVLCPVPQHLKTKLLLKILDEANEGSVLVFARTKHRAKRLAEQLGKSGHSSTCLQGNLSQNQRQRAMDGFRSGACRILVATDIAARGIDVSSVAHVVNYDLPDTPETYTHRVGRTGRAEREGQAWSLVTSEDVSMVRAIERLLGKQIARRKIDGFDYAAAPPERDREFERPPLQPRGQRGRQQFGPREGAEKRGDAAGGREASQGVGGGRKPSGQGAGAASGRSAQAAAPESGRERVGGEGSAHRAHRDFKAGGERRDGAGRAQGLPRSFKDGQPEGNRAGREPGNSARGHDRDRQPGAQRFDQPEPGNRAPGALRRGPGQGRGERDAQSAAFGEPGNRIQPGQGKGQASGPGRRQVEAGKTRSVNEAIRSARTGNAASSSDDEDEVNFNRDGVPGGFYGSVTDYGHQGVHPRKAAFGGGNKGGQQRPRRQGQSQGNWKR